MCVIDVVSLRFLCSSCCECRDRTVLFSFRLCSCLFSFYRVRYFFICVCFSVLFVLSFVAGILCVSLVWSETAPWPKSKPKPKP